MRDGPRAAELRGEGVRARQASTGVVAGAGAAAGAITSSRGRSGPQAWARAVSEEWTRSCRARAWLDLGRAGWQTHTWTLVDHDQTLTTGRSIAAGRGIPAVRRSAERAQGTSVLAGRTRSARAAARGVQRVRALTTSGRERHQDNGTRRERAA